MIKKTDTTTATETGATIGVEAPAPPGRDVLGRSEDGAPAPLRTALPPAEVMSRVERRSKQGKLPGYAREGAGADGASPAFVVAAFGKPFDKALRGEVLVQADGGSLLRFTLRWTRRLPAIAIGLLVFTVFPGVLLTHSLLGVWFLSYPSATWVTAAWYLPLCALALPVLVKQFRASSAAAGEHADETARALAKALDAAPEPGA